MKGLLTALSGIMAVRGLSQQVLAGERMDPAKLARLRAYLDANPLVLEGMKKQTETFTDPNVREAWNVLLAQVQTRKAA